MTNNEVIQSFTAQNLIIINNCILKAYEYVDIIASDFSFFRTLSANNYRQILCNLAVDYMLELACDENRLPMKYFYNKNKAKNCLHLELYYKDKILTHSSTNNTPLPRKSYFRTQYASTNQISFDDPDGLECIVEPKYGIITHTNKKCTNGKCKCALVIPDVEYGYACNYIDLNSISPIQLVTNNTSDNNTFNYDDFGFEIKNRLNKLSL